MTLKQRYQQASPTELITVLESRNDYTDECVLVVLEEIKLRHISDEEARTIATEIIEEKVRLLLKKFDPYQDKLVPPVSTFLTKDEVMKILKTAFDHWLERKETFEFDVWKYAIGGIL